MKMVMDLAGAMSLPGPMDDDRRDLAIGLCTQIGMLMEDVSAVALECCGDEIALRTRICELETATSKMADMVAAAKALVEPGGQ